MKANFHKEEKIMKKLISIISAIAVCMSFTTALAANTDNMQEVLISVKSRIDVPDELSKFESSTETALYSTEYHFEWRTEDYEKSVYVSCCDDGTITSYGYYDGYRETEPKMSKMSAADAKAIAEDFVQKINPDYPYETVVQDNNNASLYNSHRNFAITIFVNGIELENQGGNVSVDTESGEVTDFNIWYVPDTKEYFTGLDQFIPAEDAKQAYIENFPMELVYRSYYDEDNKEIFYPVYVTTDSYGEYINGVTGEKETIDFYRTFRTTGAGDLGVNEDAAASKAELTPQELEEIGNISGLISKEDIEKQLRSNKVLSIPQNAEVENIRLAKDWRSETYHYNIMLHSSEDYISADVDAKTGEIYSYYRSFDRSTNTENQNDAALRELAGGKADEFKYDDERKLYVRYVNGIEVQGNDAYLTFSDSVLTQYSISYSDAQFPSLDGVMSAEDAAEKMFEQTEYKPVCVVGYNGDNEACLYPVYSLDALSINPFTGKAVDWQNNEITPGEDVASLTYSDISGHWAESFINTLAEYGIGFEGGEFKPDEKITQSDLLTLLGTIYGGGDVIVFLDNKVQADGVYSRAISKNIINEDERDDNAVLTRETASIYLIRAIGAEQYAKYNDIYVTPFDDVTENKGYIALLSAMGVVHGDGGHFNPTREITRAEFAVMLYNYLNR